MRTFCGGAHGPGLAEFVVRGKWDSHTLKWNLAVPPRELTISDTIILIEKALATWAAETNLTFVHDQGNLNAEIQFAWAPRNHGDGFPFDGRGKVLAHAFFPLTDSEHPLRGDVHMDEDEHWKNDGGDIDTLTVLIHELGHSLGLSHTNIAGNIMFPTYSGVNHSLGTDDVDGIQSLYGEPNTEPDPDDPTEDPLNKRHSQQRTPPMILGGLARANGLLAVGDKVVARDEEGQVTAYAFVDDRGVYVLRLHSSFGNPVWVGMDGREPMISVEVVNSTFKELHLDSVDETPEEPEEPDTPTCNCGADWKALHDLLHERGHGG